VLKDNILEVSSRCHSNFLYVLVPGVAISSKRILDFRLNFVIICVGTNAGQYAS